MVSQGYTMSQIIEYFRVDTQYGVGGDFAANLIVTADYPY